MRDRKEIDERFQVLLEQIDALGDSLKELSKLLEAEEEKEMEDLSEMLSDMAMKYGEE